jgi:superfamily II DNA/RNA helicase
MSFNLLNLSPKINLALENNNYRYPTPIQEEVIPLILNGRDIVAKSKTGSGKTASFVLPILHQYSLKEESKKRKIKVLVLTPTRELTIQVADTFRIFSQYLEQKPKIVTVIGGQNIGDQLIEIQQGCDIVVATSGRLLDIIEKKQIDLSSLEYFILDEADKMLDLGFADELDAILSILPLKRNNFLFSATYPPKMLSIVSKITSNATEISIEDTTKTNENITQRAILVSKERRSSLLQKLIKENDFDKVLVFMANKRASDNIAAKFRKYGFLANSFHGDLIQEDRIYTLEAFKNEKIKILFSTDIASRGLHIDDIDCVINFDLPRSTDDYIHRIGRTGRAGKNGVAISFVDNETYSHFKFIEKKCNIQIKMETIAGFELEVMTPLKQKGQAPTKGKRKSKKDKLREAEGK